jgi:deaminated glutathione amidase
VPPRALLASVPVKAAVVQLRSGLDTAANRDAAIRAVRVAAASGAELVVLPEATMCGFGTPRTDLASLAEPLDGPFVAAVAGAAAETGATVVAGTFEPVPGEHRVSNTAVLVGPAGLIGAYRKVHLYDALGWCESDRVRAGEPGAANTPVAVVGDLPVGVLTCYDLRFPESARAAIDAGASVLAVPAAWVAGEHKLGHWQTLLAARAIENTAYVLAAAQPGPTYTGHSVILDPFGAVLGALGEADGADEPAFLVAELSAAALAEARAALPVLAQRRFASGPAETPSRP